MDSTSNAVACRRIGGENRHETSVGTWTRPLARVLWFAQEQPCRGVGEPFLVALWRPASFSY